MVILTLTSNLVKIQLFSEYGRFAYQIKGMKYTTTCNMQEIHASLTSEWGQMVKTGFLEKMVMLHLKLKRMTRTTTCNQSFIPFRYRYARPLWWGQKVKTLFPKLVMLHITLKGMKHTVSCT